MSKHGKILVAMSGGIDSTVAAVMLAEEGYEVVGITMKTWDYATSGGSKKETGCCSLDSINDARAIAVNTWPVVRQIHVCCAIRISSGRLY